MKHLIRAGSVALGIRTQGGRNIMKKRISTTALAVFSIFALASSASALSHIELGDASDLPISAQAIAGAGSLDLIKGNIGVSGDADMYRIFITGGGTFSATTVGTAGSIDDTQLFLFTSAGLGVYANDDATNVDIRSLLPAGNVLTPLTPGVYYLAISAFDKDPVSAGGLIFPSIPFNGLFGPTGPGGGTGIIGYAPSFTDTGSYTIKLTGALSSAPVPEPSALLLLGSGLVGLGFWRMRKGQV